MGFASMELKTELDNLKAKKMEIENTLLELNHEGKKNDNISSEEVRIHLINIKSFILDKNYPEIKTFIKSFVKEIVVSKEGIEVTFFPLFSFGKKFSDFQIFSFIKRNNLYEPLKRCLNFKLNKELAV